MYGKGKSALKHSENPFRLYAVTDGSRTGPEELRAVLRGGATCVQLREKELATDAFLEKAALFQAICAEEKVPLIINDRIDIALKVGAAGVHLGQSDGSLAEARRVLGPNAWIGSSVHNSAEAQAAWKNGADLLGVGAIFPTATKLDAETVSLETLRALCAAVPIPVVAIGGINRENIVRLEKSGVAGVALISALFHAPNITEATRDFALLTESLGFSAGGHLPQFDKPSAP